MSESEKKRRQLYRKNRKKWIIIQACAIAFAAVVALVMLILYSNLNKTYFVSYTDGESSDYSVVIKENDFFESGTLPSGQSYVANLIDTVNAEFSYMFKINADRVTYSYSNYVEATLEIVDTRTDKLLYAPTFILTDTAHGSSLGRAELSKTVSIDYATYESIANEFVSVYGLTSTDCRLVVSMHSSVSGTSKEFLGTAENEHISSVVIPLCEKTLSIETSSAPTGITSLLPCKRDVNPTVFEVLAIVFASLTLLAGAALTAFTYITRNDDINYEIKVKRLLNTFRSYIQVITNEFDCEGYQLLAVGSFNEMLGIRDTIQSPILMNENADKTRTIFLIPTPTKILYVFEIKADDYARIYFEPELSEAVEEESTQHAEEETYGVDVIDVQWPEDEDKLYKYDPDGETLDRGDIVLVPTQDVQRNKDVIREAEVITGNYKVDPATLETPLKKILGVVKRGIQSYLEKD